MLPIRCVAALVNCAQWAENREIKERPEGRKPEGYKANALRLWGL
jgi:hypothetical protein